MLIDGAHCLGSVKLSMRLDILISGHATLIIGVSLSKLHMDYTSHSRSVICLSVCLFVCLQKKMGSSGPNQHKK